jgi:hypothetical protein
MALSHSREVGTACRPDADGPRANHGAVSILARAEMSVNTAK